MGKIFNMDSPIMRFLSLAADLMIMNFIVTLCCLPIITIGASVTAMHYVMLKMVRGEDGYLMRDFFKSFKLNFKQATVIWLIMLLLIAIFVGDFYIVNFSGIAFPQGMSTIILIAAGLVFIVSMLIFPVLARFENNIKNTIKNGCMMSIIAAPRAILMAALTIAPVLILIFTPEIIPFVLLFGISLPAYLGAMLYSKTFKRFEPEVEPITAEEDFHMIFDDEEDLPVFDAQTEENRFE